MSKRALAVVLLGSWLLPGWLCRSGRPAVDALQAVREFTISDAAMRAFYQAWAESPHPFGSPEQAALVHALAELAKKAGLTAQILEFTENTPNPAATAVGPAAPVTPLKGLNLLVRPSSDEENPRCVVLFGSHTDSKRLENVRFIGANDSGSSTLVLLSMLRYLQTISKKWAWPCEPMGLFLDGEEAVLSQWDDGLRHPAHMEDNTYGSRHFAKNFIGDCDGKKCLKLYSHPEIRAFILLDMVGSPDLQITEETLSTPQLTEILRQSATILKFAKSPLSTHRAAVEDDHVPFLRAGVPSLDIIDFEHLDVWHQAGDVPERISRESLEIAGRLALLTGFAIANR